MFDQLVKRSDAVWIYSMGRFAEESRAFLCDLNERGYQLPVYRRFAQNDRAPHPRVGRPEYRFAKTR
jgi:hypothetical protein